MSFITRIEVEVSNIEVSDRYYNFSYKATVQHPNERVFVEGEYSSDHSWGDDKEGFKNLLASGTAANTILEEVIS